MKKILFITHYTDFYGANKSLINLISGLQKKGLTNIEVLIPRHGEIFEYCKKNGIRINIRKFESSFVTINKGGLLHFLNRLKHLPRVLNFVWQTHPDIIYSNSSVIDVGIISAVLLRKKHIWHIREFGDLDFGVYYDLGRNIFRFLLKKSDYTIFISQSIKNHIIDQLKNSSVIYNGVVFNSQIKFAKRLASDQIVRIGIVGYVIPQKGQLEAIKAFEELHRSEKKILLGIYGTGDHNYLKELKQYCQNKAFSESVNFKGYVASEQIFKEIDVLLMCSENEAMGRVTAEAMANGVPVIGKKTGATREIIRHKFDGLLYEKDHLDLANKIKGLISDQELYYRLSQNAIKKARKNFTIEGYSESVFKIIQLID